MNEELDETLGATMGDHECPQCGALPGEECDCVVEDEPFVDGYLDGEPVEPGNERLDFHESFGFDKFMDSTLIKESRARKVDATETSPQRKIAGRYQDRPANRTRFVRKP